MNFHVLTLFPEMIEQTFSTSITGRALKSGTLTLETINIRDYANNKHNKVDDYPYGGGAGMVMQPEPVYQAYKAASAKITSGKKPRIIYVTPQGTPFHQKMARDFAMEEDLIFLCGHYEGIDERVLEEIVTDYVSIGDYVLTGGELAALVMMDAVSRLVPGVLNNDVSAEFESFHGNLLEYPQYSRPEIWHEKSVPDMLLSGNHSDIEKWRAKASIDRTIERRPDLYEKYLEIEQLKAVLLKKKLLHTDLLEMLRTDDYKLIYADEALVILQEPANKMLHVTCMDEASYAKACEIIFKYKGSSDASDDSCEDADSCVPIIENELLIRKQEFLDWILADGCISEKIEIRALRMFTYTQRTHLPNPRTSKVPDKNILERMQTFVYEANRALEEGRMPYVLLDDADTEGAEILKALHFYEAPEKLFDIRQKQLAL